MANESFNRKDFIKDKVDLIVDGIKLKDAIQEGDTSAILQAISGALERN